jgi:hypothetical protein
MKASALCAALVVAALCGCSANPQNLAMYGDVKLDGNVLNSLTITHDEPAQLGRFTTAVLRNLKR